MSARGGTVLALLLLTTGLAGCLGSDPVEPQLTDVPADAPAWTPCEHPWPCADGSEWPVNLTGPYDVAGPEELRIPGHEGTELAAYVWRPVLSDDVQVPVVVYAQPYAGQSAPSGGHDIWLDRILGTLVEAGYAAVNVNVRGTGTSGGCFEMNGPHEALDLVKVIEWAADQEWSNGRVGMYGLSYMGTTPWLAANHNPSALKTIVPGGIVSDEYTFTHTPQGAHRSSVVGDVEYAAGLSISPPMSAPGDLPAWTGVAAEQVCPELVELHATYASDPFLDDRNAKYYEERQHITGFPGITASSLVFHGFRDLSGHAYQEDTVWHALEKSPKRMMLGEWGHTVPSADLLDGYPGGDDWREVIVPWLDFWLKGLGDEPPRLGVVDYQTRQGQWLESEAWPPIEGSQEAHYLASGELTAQPGSTASTYQATPEPIADTPYCEPELTSAAFVSEPLNAPATIAGNPYAFLQVEADRPGGIVAVDLYDLGPDARCEDGELTGGQWLVGGAADLRFHQGNFEGEDFPTGMPTPVRVDLINLAHTVETGHRVAVVASGHGHQSHNGQPYSPTITLHRDGSAESSHIVLPLVEGTLGGQAPTMDYPPRPFLPEGVGG